MKGEKKSLKNIQHEVLGENPCLRDIQTAVEEAVYFGTDSVCVPSSYTREARHHLDYLHAITRKTTRLFAAVGYPYGYSGTAAKTEDTMQAIANGADGIRLFPNTGKLADGFIPYLMNEIREVKKVSGVKPVSVAIKTELLDCLGEVPEKNGESGMKRAVMACASAGADYIEEYTKTRTADTKDITKKMAEYVQEANHIFGTNLKLAIWMLTSSGTEEIIKAGADMIVSQDPVRTVINETYKEHLKTGQAINSWFSDREIIKKTRYCLLNFKTGMALREVLKNRKKQHIERRLAEFLSSSKSCYEFIGVSDIRSPYRYKAVMVIEHQQQKRGCSTMYLVDILWIRPKADDLLYYDSQQETDMTSFILKTAKEAGIFVPSHMELK